MRVCLLLALLGLTAALRLPAAVVTRRGAIKVIKTSVAALVPFAALPALANPYDDAFYDSSQVSTEMSQAAAARAPRAAVPPTFAGTYSDGAHPGCKRKITRQGGAAIITGADEDGVQWRVKGTPQGNSLLVDFSSKGGPKDVVRFAQRIERISHGALPGRPALMDPSTALRTSLPQHAIALS